MLVNFFGFNGNFNGEMTKIKKNGKKSLFRGPKWFPKCLDGGFREGGGGGICIEKWSSNFRAPEVPFSVPPKIAKTPKMTHFGHFQPKMPLRVPESKF